MKTKIYILTGDIGTGKTTQLMQWCIKNSCSGILSPVIDGKRFFHDIESNEIICMEASLKETEILEVGRHLFSQKAFEWAEMRLLESKRTNSHWIIIDEIGPLELREEGFYNALMKLKTDAGKLLLVVRRSKVDAVIDKFNLENVTVITSTDQINIS